MKYTSTVSCPLTAIRRVRHFVLFFIPEFPRFVGKRFFFDSCWSTSSGTTSAPSGIQLHRRSVVEMSRRNYVIETTPKSYHEIHHRWQIDGDGYKNGRRHQRRGLLHTRVLTGTSTIHSTTVRTGNTTQNPARRDNDTAKAWKIAKTSVWLEDVQLETLGMITWGPLVDCLDEDLGDNYAATNECASKI